ncbi:MAG TPA: DUF1449 domain-containing protein [Cyanothece sp. UBA12306]|nr:DUF1449 domain-containing protein [Cyanothece sp. UBA12306]
MLFHPANLIYWMLLGIGVIFFMLIIVSGGGDEGGDLDTDLDVDSGVLEFDADVNAEVEIDTGQSGFNPWQILSWFGVGKVPLIMLLAIDFSTWGMVGLIFNIIVGSLIGTIPYRLLGIGGLVFITSLGISLVTGRILSVPIGQMFASFGEDVSSERFIGCIGTVSSKNIPYLIEGKIGQADVYDSSGNLVTISVCLPHWAKVIPYHNQSILIIEKHDHNYIAITKDSSDEDKWLDRAINPQDF